MTDIHGNGVNTVCGPISPDDLGLTLVHEHIATDIRGTRWNPDWDSEPTAWDVALGPVTPESVSLLRREPYALVQNCELAEPHIAAAELAEAAQAGVRTVIDPTCDGIGRYPELLRAISIRSGVQIVMGSGFYLEPSHPTTLRHLGADAIAEHIVSEVTEGVGPLRIRPGIIGEIGVSELFTDAERRVLQGAAKAYAQLHIPLYVHLPGWHRLGHEVLDVIEGAGGSPKGVVLCHMNPSLDDQPYQLEIIRRGAWLGYDMVGMDLYYGDDGLQCPNDTQNAAALAGIYTEVGLGKVLISSDVFIRSMLKHYGGNGYAYVPAVFAKRLVSVGVPEGDVNAVLSSNPNRLFDEAAGRTDS